MDDRSFPRPPWVVRGLEEAEQRVSKGLAWLLESGPARGLRVEDVDLTTLDLQACGYCVLGQLGGDYNDVLASMGMSQAWATEHGFDISSGSDFQISYWMLNRQWREQIKAHRDMIADSGQ